MKFSEKLTELRHSRGWSQEQLGERLGVTRQTVSDAPDRLQMGAWLYYSGA